VRRGGRIGSPKWGPKDETTYYLSSEVEAGHESPKIDPTSQRGMVEMVPCSRDPGDLGSLNCAGRMALKAESQIRDNQKVQEEDKLATYQRKSSIFKKGNRRSALLAYI